MARVSVLFSLALLQGVSAAPTGGRTLEPEPVDDTERVNRETGRQVATDDYSGDHGLDTRWDTTEDTVLLRTIMRAAVGGIAAYQHHAPCQNGMARPRITDVQRYGLSWLSSFGHTEYAIYARINGAASHVRLRVSIGNRGASPPPEARRRVSGSALLPADGPAFDDDAPLLTHVEPLDGLPACVVSQIEEYSAERNLQTLPYTGTQERRNWEADNNRTYDPEFGEEQPEADLRAGAAARAAVAAARSTKHGTGVKISAVLHMPPPRNESHKIAAGMQYHYDGKTPYAMGLLPSAGDVLVHSIKLSAIPDEYGAFHDIPSAYSSVPAAAIARFPARSQGACGACAFFAASSMMTLKYWAEAFRRGVSPTASSLPLLSAQGMVACGRLPRNGDGAPTHAGGGWTTYDGGCCGASLDRVMDYLIDHGITSEACYPYTSDATPCVACARARGLSVEYPVCRDTCIPEYSSSHGLDPAAPFRVVRGLFADAQQTMYADYSDLQLSSPLTGVRMFKGPENIARAMMRYGAMTCGIDVTPAFQSGTGVLWQEGVYTGVTADPGTEIPEGATSNIGSHAVVCYGFGTTDSGIPYWECLNSWGSTWGTGGNGHFKLRRGGPGAGVLGMDGTLPVRGGSPSPPSSHGCYDVAINPNDVHTAGMHTAPTPPRPSPPPPYTAPPPSRFVEVHSGTCEDHGYTMIDSIERCRAALDGANNFVLGSANMTGRPPSFPLSSQTLGQESSGAWRHDVPNGCSVQPLRYVGGDTWNFAVSWQPSNGCVPGRETPRFTGQTTNCGCGTYQPRSGDPGYDSSTGNNDISGNICICDRGDSYGPVVYTPPSAPPLPTPSPPCSPVSVTVVPNFDEDRRGGACPNCGFDGFGGSWVVDGAPTAQTTNPSGFYSPVGMYADRPTMLRDETYLCGPNPGHLPGGANIPPPTEPLSQRSRGLMTGDYICDGFPHRIYNMIIDGVRRSVFRTAPTCLSHGRHFVMLTDTSGPCRNPLPGATCGDSLNVEGGWHGSYLYIEQPGVGVILNATIEANRVGSMGAIVNHFVVRAPGEPARLSPPAPTPPPPSPPPPPPLSPPPPNAVTDLGGGVYTVTTAVGQRCSDQACAVNPSAAQCQAIANALGRPFQSYAGQYAETYCGPATGTGTVEFQLDPAGVDHPCVPEQGCFCMSTISPGESCVVYPPPPSAPPPPPPEGWTADGLSFGYATTIFQGQRCGDYGTLYTVPTQAQCQEIATLLIRPYQPSAASATESGCYFFGWTPMAPNDIDNRPRAPGSRGATAIEFKPTTTEQPCSSVCFCASTVRPSFNPPSPPNPPLSPPPNPPPPLPGTPPPASPPPPTFDTLTLNQGARCSEQGSGWGKATQTQCEAIRANLQFTNGITVEMGVENSDGSESGCISFTAAASTDHINYVISASDLPCPAVVCWCTRPAGWTAPPVASPPPAPPSPPPAPSPEPNPPPSPSPSPPPESPPPMASPSPSPPPGPFTYTTISQGQSCSGGGYEQASESQCQSIAGQEGRSFAALQDFTGSESGCVSWGSADIEYMRSPTVFPCPAPTCYCTRAGSASPPPAESPPPPPEPEDSPPPPSPAGGGPCAGWCNTDRFPSRCSWRQCSGCSACGQSAMPPPMPRGPCMGWCNTARFPSRCQWGNCNGCSSCP